MKLSGFRKDFAPFARGFVPPPLHSSSVLGTPEIGKKSCASGSSNALLLGTVPYA